MLAYAIRAAAVNLGIIPDDDREYTDPELCMVLYDIKELAARPKLKVWFGKMPESNGKTNWTGFLYRDNGGELDYMDSFQIDRSEYKDRVRYEVDRLRYVIGETDKEPNILEYDGDLKGDA